MSFRWYVRVIPCAEAGWPSIDDIEREMERQLSRALPTDDLMVDSEAGYRLPNGERHPSVGAE